MDVCGRGVVNPAQNAWHRSTSTASKASSPVGHRLINQRPHPFHLLMEQVWRIPKQKLAIQRFCADVERLEPSATTLLSQLEAPVHAVTPPGIRLLTNSCEAAWNRFFDVARDRRQVGPEESIPL